MDDHRFGFEKLFAFQRAREFGCLAHRVLRGLPRGESALADQLRRAGDSVLLNIAEGAGRTTGTEQARYYDIARGSANECAAVIAVCEIRVLASTATLQQARAVLHETVRLLTGLARAARGRVG